MVFQAYEEKYMMYIYALFCIINDYRKDFLCCI